MFEWLKRRFSGQAPTVPAAATPAAARVYANPRNPAKSPRFRLTVDGPAGYRQESLDLVEILARVFRELGRQHSVEGSTLTDTLSGVRFMPGIATFQAKDDLSMQTCTTVEIAHDAKIPAPIFEFQHSAGATGELSILKGFQDWGSVDLPVILDALVSKPGHCTALEFKEPSRTPRRILLGTVLLMVPENAARATEESEEHPRFCRCCLFTHSIEAFKPLVDAGGFAAVRLYAARSPDGSAQADCRVNGEDFPAGAEALRAYVGTWPGTDYETRKQYIIIQDKPA